MIYRLSSAMSIGLMVKHAIEISETRHSSITRPERADFQLPLQMTLGVSGIVKGFRISLDNEVIHGEYGGMKTKESKFWLIRAGAEKQVFERFALRAGLIAPVVAWTSSLGDVRDDMPWPKMAATLGVGVNLGKMTVDAALSGDHGRSYVENTIRLKGILSTTLSF